MAMAMTMAMETIHKAAASAAADPAEPEAAGAEVAVKEIQRTQDLERSWLTSN
jgi:hypothetical protein